MADKRIPHQRNRTRVGVTGGRGSRWNVHLSEVVSDPEARHFGGRVEERSLVPLGEARPGRIGFDE